MTRFVCLVCLLGLTSRTLFAEEKEANWSQWRGPNRDGLVPGNDWPETLKGLEKTWRVEKLGPSYSGPIVYGDRVFTTETVNKEKEVVRCLDRKTGNELWKKDWLGSLTVPFFAAKNGSWIRSTPAYDGEALYIGGIRDVLVCLEGKDGSERWRYDFPKETGAKLPDFGFVCSPLVDDKAVYVQAGGSFVKVDKRTGKLIWKSLEDGGGMYGSAFSSPTFAKIGGKEQIVVQTRTKLAGVDKETGELLWSKEIPSFRGMNILTPAIFGEGVFTSTYGGNTRLLTIEAKDKTFDVKDAWSVKYEGHMTSPVVVDEHAYLLGKDRRVICVNLKSGSEMWRTEQRFGEYWNLIAQKDKILALDETGKLYLIKANPKEYQQLDVKTVSDSPTWAHLAIVGEELFIRDLQALTSYRWKK